VDASLTKFLLLEKSNDQVTINIHNDSYLLKPASSTGKLIAAAQPIQFSPTSIYQRNIQNEMDPSHANTLSWLITQVNHHMAQRTGSYTIKEVQALFVKSLPLLRSPVRERVILLQHRINCLESEIERLSNQRLGMEGEAKQRGVVFLTALLVASIVQIGAFYYGIYMVEEWGWDVCEPFSYTL
jgi:hypothetical protein